MPHGTDAATSDGLPTPMAEGSSALMIVELTEWTSIQFKKGASRKTAEAVLEMEKRKGMHVSRGEISAK